MARRKGFSRRSSSGGMKSLLTGAIGYAVASRYAGNYVAGPIGAAVGYFASKQGGFIGDTGKIVLAVSIAGLASSMLRSTNLIPSATGNASGEIFG